MLQVFESSADYITKEQFALVSLPYCKQIRDKLIERLTSQGIDPVPMVIYAKGGGHSLKEQSQFCLTLFLLLLQKNFHQDMNKNRNSITSPLLIE